MAFFGGAVAVHGFVPLAGLGCSFLKRLAGTAGPVAGKERSGVILKANARAADPVVEDDPPSTSRLQIFTRAAEATSLTNLTSTGVRHDQRSSPHYPQPTSIQLIQ